MSSSTITPKVKTSRAQVLHDTYRPQWAFPTPKGFHDEEFIVGPFPLQIAATGALTLSVPVQLDDDVHYFIRAIMISAQIGTLIVPGMLARIRDCFGNPLSDGLVLGLGIWANQLNAVNAFGFVMEPEVECSPGGTILFDFQCPSNGTAASLIKIVSGESITFTAAIMGAAGNSVSIELVNPGAANVPLSVAVVGQEVEVTLATNGASAITTTFAQLQALLNSTPAVQALLFATIAGPDPAQVITALTQTSLSGGANGSPITLFGTFIGVKRFPDCL